MPTDTAPEPTPEPVKLDPKSELAEAHKECVQNGGVVSPRLAAAVNALTGTKAGAGPENAPKPDPEIDKDKHTAHKKGH